MLMAGTIVGGGEALQEGGAPLPSGTGQFAAPQEQPTK